MASDNEKRNSTFYVEASEPVCKLTDSGTMFTDVGKSQFYHGNEPVHTCTSLVRQRTITGSTVTQTGQSHFYSKPSLKELHLTPPNILETSCAKPSKLRKIGTVKFPQMKEFAHFHYDKINISSIQAYIDTSVHVASGSLYEVIVLSNGHQWVVYRSFKDFLLLDKQIHYCVFDRKYSQLLNLRSLSGDNIKNITTVVSDYLNRFSELSCNSINCGTVLNFFEINSSGEHLISSMNESAINIPAIAAALVIKTYKAQEVDELDLKPGDLVSVIDIPDQSESLWWRGKKGLEVGFFPGNCVEVIGKDRRKSTDSTKSQRNSDYVMSRTDKIKAFLRMFFRQRPQRIQLKQSGIVLERVFGTDLGEYLMNSALVVPDVLTICTQAIEYHGIIDGIYRLSGAAPKVQKLREDFDLGQKTTFTDNDILDIHSITSVVKTYFRELPNPLMTYQLYQPLVDALRLPPLEQVQTIKALIERLPPPHYRTAKHLFCHLHKLSVYSKRTGMTTRNLAIVWAPNIMRYDESLVTTGSAILNNISRQAAVTDTIITNYDFMFAASNSDNLVSFGRKPMLLPLSNRLLTLSVARRRKDNSPSTTSGKLNRNKSMSAESFFGSSSSSVIHLLPGAIHKGAANDHRSISSNSTDGYDTPLDVSSFTSSSQDIQSTGRSHSRLQSFSSIAEYEDPQELLSKQADISDTSQESVYHPLHQCQSKQAGNKENMYSVPDEISYNNRHSDPDCMLPSSQAERLEYRSLNPSEVKPTSKQNIVSPVPKPRNVPKTHHYVNMEIIKANVHKTELSTDDKSHQETNVNLRPVPSQRRRKPPVTIFENTDCSAHSHTREQKDTPLITNAEAAGSPVDSVVNPHRELSTVVNAETEVFQQDASIDVRPEGSILSQVPINDEVIYENTTDKTTHSKSNIPQFTDLITDGAIYQTTLVAVNSLPPQYSEHHPETRPPLRLAYSNPLSNDDAIKVPSRVQTWSLDSE